MRSHPIDETVTAAGCSRRTAIKQCAAGLLAAGTLAASAKASIDSRNWVTTRGIYGGFPDAMLDRGETPADYGVNAMWVGSGGLNQQKIDQYRELGLKIFAEFNSMHYAAYLKEHPDAAPIGPDGKPSPPPHDWQGVSSFHRGYRQNRMDEFRRVLETYHIDGIWLDYHHAHASWERAEPVLPDTDFSPAALDQFSEQTGVNLPADVAAAATLLLGKYRDAWTQFRCDVFTDWVREYREILNEIRPDALLGTFHCPWSSDDFGGAIRHKLAIDLPAQSMYVDVFSIMPYHARFGHPQDPKWIARQTSALGELLELEGRPDEKQKIWPIVQLADWGENVGVEQISEIINYATRRPATGVMIFHWSGVSKQWEKVEAMGKAYRALRS